MEAFRHTLGKKHLSLISYCDSAFEVWNILISPKEQVQYILEREPRRDESEQSCYMVQGNDSLEVNSEFIIDYCASTFNDNTSNEDAHMLNEGLSCFVKIY